MPSALAADATENIGLFAFCTRSSKRYRLSISPRPPAKPWIRGFYCLGADIKKRRSSFLDQSVFAERRAEAGDVVQRCL